MKANFGTSLDSGPIFGILLVLVLISFVKGAEINCIVLKDKYCVMPSCEMDPEASACTGTPCPKDVPEMGDENFHECPEEPPDGGPTKSCSVEQTGHTRTYNCSTVDIQRNLYLDDKDVVPPSYKRYTRNIETQHETRFGPQKLLKCIVHDTASVSAQNADDLLRNAKDNQKECFSEACAIRFKLKEPKLTKNGRRKTTAKSERMITRFCDNNYDFVYNLNEGWKKKSESESSNKKWITTVFVYYCDNYELCNSVGFPEPTKDSKANRVLGGNIFLICILALIIF